MIAVPEKSLSASARGSPAADQTQTWVSNNVVTRFSIFSIPVCFHAQEIPKNHGGFLGAAKQSSRRAAGNWDQFGGGFAVAGNGDAGFFLLHLVDHPEAGSLELSY